MDFVPVDLGSRLVDYEEGWALQREVHADVVAGRRPPTVLLVEHEAVFTAGKRTNAADRPMDGSRVIDVDRGGRITWHGPGQLVAYPIVPLRSPIDVVAYVRALESAVINVCTESGLDAIRVAGRSGVWLPASEGRPERKVCAIGVRVAQRVTMHGLALNCDTDLADFGRIVPCGIPDAGVTSLTAETGAAVSVLSQVAPLQQHLLAALADVAHITLSADRSTPVPTPALT